MSPREIVRLLFDVILRLVSLDEARAELDAAAVRRQNTIADAAERKKFGRSPR